MDLNIYEKTRYQNIYRHKKNKNYLIQIKQPKTTISRDRLGNKIFDIEVAKSIAINPNTKEKKKVEISNKQTFDEMWLKYVSDCQNIKRLAYNTLVRKEKEYTKHFKNKFKKPITKITEDDLRQYIEKEDTTLKEKNTLIKDLKAFFNWLVENKYIYKSPATYLKRYKVEKNIMKFWSPSNLSQFLSTLQETIENETLDREYRLWSYRIKIFTFIEISLGDRVGETRAIKYSSINRNHKTIQLRHSIDYNPNTKDYLGNMKTSPSERDLEITDTVIKEIDNYRNFIEKNTIYEVGENDFILYNYELKKPYSDSALRKYFYEFINKAGVPKIRPYDLRHTYVALMMSEGKELYHISKRLGHSKYSTTVDQYGHLDTQIKSEIAQVSDKYLNF